jgi:hypothetical protein
LVDKHGKLLSAALWAAGVPQRNGEL